MDGDKVFCGSGQERETKHGPFLKLSFSEKDLEVLAAHLKNGWVNVTVSRMREPKKNRTHYLCIDFWQPQSKGDQRPEDRQSVQASAPAARQPEDDTPDFLR